MPNVSYKEQRKNSSLTFLFTCKNCHTYKIGECTGSKQTNMDECFVEDKGGV